MTALRQTFRILESAAALLLLSCLISPRRLAGEEKDRIAPVDDPRATAVLKALRWLARHQSADGSWSTQGFSAHCKAMQICSGPGSRGHDAGLTGLALLAYLRAGYGPSTQYDFEDPFKPGRRIRFADALSRGLAYLKNGQDGEGAFPKQTGEFMYDQAIATLAMVEAAALADSPLYREAAQRGIDFLVKAQNPGFAWRYTARSGDNDTSVTGWCLRALRSAELSGYKVPAACYQGAHQWLVRVTDTRGIVGYESPGDAGSVMPGLNDRWASHPAMTAVGLFIDRSVFEKGNEHWQKIASAMVLRDPPVWNEERKTIDYYYWHYGALALDRRDGPAAETFRKAAEKALLEASAREQPGRCAEGSLSPLVDRWGSVGGRVYATALNALTLEECIKKTGK